LLRLVDKPLKSVKERREDKEAINGIEGRLLPFGSKPSGGKEINNRPFGITAKLIKIKGRRLASRQIKVILISSRLIYWL